MIRVLLAKPTHDCHDRGVRYLANGLRDAGFEVIFTNFLLAQELVQVAIQESVDVVGVSSSSGGHVEVLDDLLRGLAEAGASDLVVIAGGVIPDDDAAALKARGLRAVFGPGSTLAQVVAFLTDAVHRR